MKMLEYPVVITRTEQGDDGIVTFPDFPDFEEMIEWKSADEMMRRCMTLLGLAYYLHVEEAGRPEPSASVFRPVSTARRVVGACRCNYDRFKELALQVKEFDLS